MRRARDYLVFRFVATESIYLGIYYTNAEVLLHEEHRVIARQQGCYCTSASVTARQLECYYTIAKVLLHVSLSITAHQPEHYHTIAKVLLHYLLYCERSDQNMLFSCARLMRPTLS